MDIRPTTVERAYQLAASGECASVAEVKQRLDKEGYANVVGQLYGPTIQAALRKLCAASQLANAAATPSLES